MSYTGDIHPSNAKYDKDGKLIDPEESIIEDLLNSMGNVIKLNCFNCKHLNPDEVSCKAFSEQIPSEIYYGDVSHDVPYKGDNGIQHEFKKED